jgi:hypothetical protein
MPINLALVEMSREGGVGTQKVSGHKPSKEFPGQGRNICWSKSKMFNYLMVCRMTCLLSTFMRKYKNIFIHSFGSTSNRINLNF